MSEPVATSGLTVTLPVAAEHASCRARTAACPAVPLWNRGTCPRRCASHRAYRSDTELQPRRWGSVGLEDIAHLVEGIRVVGLGVRRDAVGGHVQSKFAHIGVIGREQHADVAGNPREN